MTDFDPANVKCVPVYGEDGYDDRRLIGYRVDLRLFAAWLLRLFEQEYELSGGDVTQACFNAADKIAAGVDVAHRETADGSAAHSGRDRWPLEYDAAIRAAQDDQE